MLSISTHILAISLSILSQFALEYRSSKVFKRKNKLENGEEENKTA
jgi:hypothetical protein